MFYLQKGINQISQQMFNIRFNIKIIMFKFTNTIKFSTFKSVTNLELLYQHTNQTKTPFFTLDSHHINIIQDPLDFYVTLQRQIKKTTFRIGLSSLYLGTGSLQRCLMSNIIKKLQKHSNMQAVMLFDYNRSMRQEKGESSIQMMNHYLNQDIKSQIKIGFNRQAKSFNGVLGEIKGVHHQKIYLFDNTVIVGGANLSHNYFLNRKDRYLKFNESSQFSDYLYDYLQTLVENCHQISNSNQPLKPIMPNLQKHFKMWKFSYQPPEFKSTLNEQEQYLEQLRKQKGLEQNRKIESQSKKHIPQSRNIELAQDLGTSIQQIPQVNKQQRVRIREQTRERLFGAGDEHDVNNFLIDIQKMGEEESEVMERGEKVYIFPFVHFPSLKETRQPQILNKILKNSTQRSLTINISSGYMNFTKSILNTLADSQHPITLLCSSPLANSFFRAGLFKKYIPFFYRCFQANILQKYQNKFKIKEFYNGIWSFHAKGIWIKENERDYLTVVGSSNFNERSVQRDTELQVYVYSSCKEFNMRLDREWLQLDKNCQQISVKQIKEDSEIKYNLVSKVFAKIFCRYL